MKILSIGEILWDVVGDVEHLGGAPFNLAVHARRLGEDTIFISAVGADARGQRALAKLLELGLPASYISTVSTYPTGWVSVYLNPAGQPTFTIHRPAAYDDLVVDSGQVKSIAKWKPDWICFGTLLNSSAQARLALETLISSNPGARRFYDVNLRPKSYTPELVQTLVRSADTVKINEDEAEALASMYGIQQPRRSGSYEHFCRTFAQAQDLRVVCITLGSRGCALLVEETYCEADGYPVKVVDTIGAGDAFSAALLHGLGRAWPPAQIADFANRVGSLVASRAGAITMWSPSEVQTMSRDDKAAGF